MSWPCVYLAVNQPGTLVGAFDLRRSMRQKAQHWKVSENTRYQSDFVLNQES